VDDLDAALTTAKKMGGEVVTTGGSPAVDSTRAARVVTLRDPDGYYVEFLQPRGVPPGSGKVIGAAFGSMVVPDAGKAASFYRDQFGFTVKLNDWNSEAGTHLGTPGAKIHSAEATIPGANLSWGFLEFGGVDRKPYTPRIPDPGAPAIGLQVHDIDAVIAAVKAAGGASVTHGGSLRLGNGRVGFVRDPSGVLVELAQP
jgi:predicted enzyme related to lactoylglutathione lyase